MDSDVDQVIVKCSPPVVCQAECLSDLAFGLLLIPDQKFPGYVKLEVLSDRSEKFTNKQDFVKNISTNAMKFWIQLDSKDRQCLTCKYLTDFYGTKFNNQHGPALQIKSDKSRPNDIVLAFECDTWPTLASEWRTRRRKNGWPSRNLIEKIKTYGFIVVRACHPQSDEKDLQWRISFSRQERVSELVVNFNPVQMKCYVLLELIKNT